ncbi:MAG: hypothetical protein DMF24_11985 [Verrucomicrobia bacterium]|nr:MAG: hypothetical protein DMF24_11985 [Verrucomicrobiota bacterium]
MPAQTTHTLRQSQTSEDATTAGSVVNVTIPMTTTRSTTPNGYGKARTIGKKILRSFSNLNI